jgi:Zn-finger nucleic acid-binding protein
VLGPVAVASTAARDARNPGGRKKKKESWLSEIFD